MRASLLKPWMMCGLAALAAAAFSLRGPGLDVRDGRNDRGKNGVAIGPEWITGDATPSALAVGEFARATREHHIAELAIALPPPNAEGALTGIDSARIDALLYECYQARGWGRISLAGSAYDDPRWRRFFITDLRRLLDRLPRLRGVMLDLADVNDVSPALLTLLDELRPVLATDSRPLAIVAHAWEAPYFREVARRADQLVIPLEISASPFSRFAGNAAVKRIREAFAACEGKPVLLSIPADRRLQRGLATIHFAFGKTGAPEQFAGVFLQTSTAPDPTMWADLRTHFLRP